MLFCLFNLFGPLCVLVQLCLLRILGLLTVFPKALELKFVRGKIAFPYERAGVCWVRGEGRGEGEGGMSS